MLAVGIVLSIIQSGYTFTLTGVIRDVPKNRTRELEHALF
jgi:hypothetical protein